MTSQDLLEEIICNVARNKVRFILFFSFVFFQCNHMQIWKYILFIGKKLVNNAYHYSSLESQPGIKNWEDKFHLFWQFKRKKYAQKASKQRKKLLNINTDLLVNNSWWYTNPHSRGASDCWAFSLVTHNFRSYKWNVTLLWSSEIRLLLS